MLLGRERHGRVESAEIAPSSSSLVEAFQLTFLTDSGWEETRRWTTYYTSGREGYSFCVVSVSLCVCDLRCHRSSTAHSTL